MADTNIIAKDQHTGLMRLVRLTFDNGGQQSYSNPPLQEQDSFEQFYNWMPVTTGGLVRRWGSDYIDEYTTNNSLQLTTDPCGAWIVQGNFLTKYLVTAGWKYGFGSAVEIVTEVMNGDGTGAGAQLGRYFKVTANTVPGTVNGFPEILPYKHQVFYNQRGLVGSGAGAASTWGFGVVWPDNAFQKAWGEVAPAQGNPTIGAPIAGAVNLTNGRKYFTVFRNSLTGHCGPLSPVSLSTGAAVNKQFPLAWPGGGVNAPINSDNAVLLATADGGNQQVLYKVAEFAASTLNGGAYNDNTPEATLLASDIYQEIDVTGTEIGVASNFRPVYSVTTGDAHPAVVETLPMCFHKGRMFMGQGAALVWTKAVNEVVTSTGTVIADPPQAFPTDNNLTLSDGTEIIRALVSDGNILYIGTSSHIRKMFGDNTEDFTIPEIAFNNVGVASSRTWLPVFLEGAPIGVMWLTPDKKVIGSDFNVYQDIGKPVQDVLNNIDLNYIHNAWMIMHNEGPYSFMLLGIPIIGLSGAIRTILMFDMRRKKWHVWFMPSTVSAAISLTWRDKTPACLFFGAYGWYWLRSGNTADFQNPPVGGAGGTAFNSSVRSTWQHFDQPTFRKTLNAFKVYTNNTLTLTLEGASTAADWLFPTTIASGISSTTSPMGDTYFYLAGYRTKFRWYRYTLTTASSFPSALDGIDIEALAIQEF